MVFPRFKLTINFTNNPINIEFTYLGYQKQSKQITANSKNIVLEKNIGNEGKVSSTIWRVFVYFLVISGLLAYTYAVLKKRK